MDVDSRLNVVGAALALAAHHFPAEAQTVRFDDVHFLLSGRLSLWSGWPSLDPESQRRIARLLRFRENDLANRNVLRSLLHQLREGEVPGFRRIIGDVDVDTDTDVIELDLGRPALDLADEFLATLEAERQMTSRPLPKRAPPGDYLAYVRREVNGLKTVTPVTYRIDAHLEAPEPEPLRVGPPAVADQMSVPLLDLRDLADRLDAAYEQPFRRKSLDTVFANLKALPGHEVDESWELNAGATEILHAPTGFGKSVLTELTACWCAQRGLVVTVLVSTNAAVVKTAHAITQHLDVLSIPGDVVPLTSPRSAQKVAENAARGNPSPDGPGYWAFNRLAYGCALPATAETAAVEAWEPGQEPCTRLKRVGFETARYQCPWLARCGKFRNIRLASTAQVIVTTFDNWLSGQAQLPTEIDGRVQAGISVEELLLRRSHLVLIDELDEFQSSMIKRNANRLVLAHRRAEQTPLRRVHRELYESRDRIASSVHSDARAATNLALELSEAYVAHLADGQFDRLAGPGRARRPLQGRWMLPRNWDAYLAQTLFAVPEGERPTREHYEMLGALFSVREDVTVPEWLVPVQAALAQLQVNAGDDFFAVARWILLQSLEACDTGRLADPRVRARVTHRLIRRAYLERLRSLQTKFIYLAPHLEAAGVSSASELSDNLGQLRVWRAAPYGPLGRALFAFREDYDPDRPQDTALSVNGWGGDPHEYVTRIGDVTSLAHFGHRRCVVGLSATSFLPGAPHHHVFALPTWWVEDSSTGGFELQVSPVSDEEAKFVRVSGTSGDDRRQTLRKLATLLWNKHLTPELTRLATQPETRGRQRLLLATTSYEGVEDVAEGLSHAGVPREHLVVAVRPDVAESKAQSSRWQALSADQLESFGRRIDGRVLVAPLARAARGINMADDNGVSLIGSVWLVVRPVPIMDEPAEILAHVHASVAADAPPSEEPGGQMHLVRSLAGIELDKMFDALPYFRTLPHEVRMGITAENLIGLIQLAGRARRGQTTGRIHLVDYAFIDEGGNSSLPRLIRDLRACWEETGATDTVRALFGRTIDTIFELADKRRTDERDDLE